MFDKKKKKKNVNPRRKIGPLRKKKKGRGERNNTGPGIEKVAEEIELIASIRINQRS